MKIDSEEKTATTKNKQKEMSEMKKNLQLKKLMWDRSHMNIDCGGRAESKTAHTAFYMLYI